jgi:cation diffusion facilitator family transporter
MSGTESQSRVTIQKYILWGGMLLFAIKCIAFFITNSVGILSDALESTVNIITGFLTLKSLQYAARPRDEDHPYGHGKVELITASVEGILIGIAGIMIIYEAVQRLGEPSVIVKMDTGLLLMASTAVANFAMGRYSITMGKKMQSIALISGGRHLLSDTYTTLALTAGLILYFITGYTWVDSLLAIIFGIFILYTGYQVLKETINGLLDEADSKALDNLVQTLSNGRREAWINIHKLTYLKFGHVSHVDMHLTLPWYYNMAQAETEISALKYLVRPVLPEADVDVSVQSEPCNGKLCPHCKLECPHREYAFESERYWTTEKITGKNMFVKNKAK